MGFDTIFLFTFGVLLIIIDKGWGFGGDLLPLFCPGGYDLWLDCVCSSDLTLLHT